MTQTQEQTLLSQMMTSRTSLHSANRLQPFSSQTSDRSPRAPLGPPALKYQHALELEVFFKDDGVSSRTFSSLTPSISSVWFTHNARWPNHRQPYC